MWSSAIPLIFYINQNKLLRFSWKGDRWQTWYILYFHIFTICSIFFLFAQMTFPFLFLGFVREMDLAEGFNLWFSTGVNKEAMKSCPSALAIWDVAIPRVRLQHGVTSIMLSTGTNSALEIKHPTWRQVIQCWSQCWSHCWQGWTAQMSLWLFPTWSGGSHKEFPLLNSSRRKMPKGPWGYSRTSTKGCTPSPWKEFSFTPSHTHTHSPRLPALTNLLEVYGE